MDYQKKKKKKACIFAWGDCPVIARPTAPCRGFLRLGISIALVLVTLAAAHRHGLAATALCLLDMKSMLTEGSWPDGYLKQKLH